MQIFFDVEAKLRQKYNSPHFDNKEDPMDELVYILLSKRTNLKGNQKAFINLKEKFHSWADIVSANMVDIKKCVSTGGLVEEKATNLRILCEKIYQDFHTMDLRKALQNKKWTEQEIFEYLITLPGIGPKSAYCVMLYSLKIPAMPADAHVIRVFNKIGAVPFVETQHHQAQKYISELLEGLPWSMLYSLHVNAKAHGERVCKKNKCLADECVIVEYCKFTQSSFK